MRLGSIASAPFLGTQFASLHIGAVRVPTVPGNPVVISAVLTLSPAGAMVTFTAPASDGGSAVTEYVFYFNGAEVVPSNINGGVATFSQSGLSGQVRASAVNLIGVGPLSDPVTVSAF